MKFCKFKNCNLKHHSKGYCHKHYQAIIYKGSYKRYKCKIKNCNITTIQKICYKHKLRIKRNLPLDLSLNLRNYNKTGKNAPNWQGGISKFRKYYYPFPALLKKNRLIVLINNPSCEYCGKPATEIHHKDFSKSNHQLSNLMAVCHPCNSKLRNPNKPQISKYRRIYGRTIQELKEFGFPYSYLYNYTNRLEKILKG